MVTLVDTRTLQAITERVVQSDTFLTDMFFMDNRFYNTKFIDVETIVESETIAEFCAPCVRGESVGDEGSRIDSFAPAYIKQEMVLEPCNYMNRLPGEDYNSGLTPSRRMMMDLTSKMMRLENRIKRRLEWMAAKAMLDGAITIAGDTYPMRTIDFNRDPGNTVVNIAADYWSATTSQPLQQIEDAGQIIIEMIGVGPGDLILDAESWKNLIKHQDFMDQLDFRRGITDVPNVSPMIASRKLFRGFLGEIAIWTYTGNFLNKLGVKEKFIPNNRALLVARGPDGLMGEKAYGVIQDVKVMESMARYSKIYDDEALGTRNLVLQTAPLLIPKRPNAVVVIHTGL